jgi:hypothetical protein
MTLGGICPTCGKKTMYGYYTGRGTVFKCRNCDTPNATGFLVLDISTFEKREKPKPPSPDKSIECKMFGD